MTSNKNKIQTSGNGNKKKSVPKFRNVLAQPIPRYWPEISDVDLEDLKQLILELKKQHEGDEIYLKENGIYLGLNVCSRKLKTGNVSFILLSTEIKPKFIANQMICMVLSNYPQTKLLCVPNLKEFTGQMFDIQSLALGLVKPMTSFAKELESWVIKKCEVFAIPEKLIQFYCKEEKKHDTEKLLEKKCERGNKVEKNHTNVCDQEIDFDKFYLKRPVGIGAGYRRVYVPENAKHLKSLNFEIEDSKSELLSDYISFSGETMQIQQSQNLEKEDSDNECRKDKTKLVKIFKKMISPAKTKQKEENHLESDIVQKNKTQQEIMDVDNELVSESESLNNKVTNVNVSEQSTSIILNSNEENKKRKRRKRDINSSDCNYKKLSLQEPVFKYIPLHVNKIQGNPNKKKKRKNNK